MPKKPRHGEAMKTRPFRDTDKGWADLKLVTPEKVRQWIKKQAAKLRREK